MLSIFLLLPISIPMTTPMNIANKKETNTLYRVILRWYIRLPFDRSFCNLKNTSKGDGKVSIFKIDAKINQNINNKIKDNSFINKELFLIIILFIPIRT
jgi:hypothetical protein